MPDYLGADIDDDALDNLLNYQGTEEVNPVDPADPALTAGPALPATPVANANGVEVPGGANDDGLAEANADNVLLSEVNAELLTGVGASLSPETKEAIKLLAQVRFL
jgi:hypothetical protein